MTAHQYYSSAVYWVLYSQETHLTTRDIESTNDAIKKLKLIAQRVFEAAEKKYGKLSDWKNREVYVLYSPELQILSIKNNIYITLGLIQKLNLDEIAMVMGHEVGHDVKGHKRLIDARPFDTTLREKVELEADEIWIILWKEAWFDTTNMMTFLWKIPLISSEQIVPGYPADILRVQHGNKIIATLWK